jgi:hypothetical protein
VLGDSITEALVGTALGHYVARAALIPQMLSRVIQTYPHTTPADLQFFLKQAAEDVAAETIAAGKELRESSVRARDFDPLILGISGDRTDQLYLVFECVRRAMSPATASQTLPTRL